MQESILGHRWNHSQSKSASSCREKTIPRAFVPNGTSSVAPIRYLLPRAVLSLYLCNSPNDSFQRKGFYRTTLHTCSTCWTGVLRLGREYSSVVLKEGGCILGCKIYDLLYLCWYPLIGIELRISLHMLEKDGREPVLQAGLAKRMTTIGEYARCP